MNAFANILDDSTANEPWHRDPPDKDPRDEFARQLAFLRDAHRYCPAVDVVAIPNAGTGTDWERLRRWREGARTGALDIKASWGPPAGVAFLEFKNGTDSPSKAQRERLNRYHRMGHHCGLFRSERSAIAMLYRAGAPFLFIPDWLR